MRYLNATRRLATGTGLQLTGGQAENPCVVSHDRWHRLLFTDWQDPEDGWQTPAPRTIVLWAVSPTLTADSLGSANWVYRGSTPDPGVNACEVPSLGPDAVLISQSISNGAMMVRCGDWSSR